MTDYLEKLLDSADALLEQVRRLERSGGPVREEEPPAPDAGRDQAGTGEPEEKKRFAGSPEGTAWNRNRSQWAEPERNAAADAGEASARFRRVPFQADQEETGSPLLKQVVQLERAAAGLGTGTAPGWYPDRNRGSPAPGLEAGAGFLHGAGAAVLTWSGTERSGRPGAGGDLDWAEQADRAFRRDSRRYDGGFYLY